MCRIWINSTDNVNNEQMAKMAKYLNEDETGNRKPQQQSIDFQ